MWFLPHPAELFIAGPFEELSSQEPSSRNQPQDKEEREGSTEEIFPLFFILWLIFILSFFHSVAHCDMNDPKEFPWNFFRISKGLRAPLRV